MLKYAIASLLLAGCVTTNSQLGEPERSVFYSLCLQNNITVTACACIEKKAAEETGITRVRTDEASSAFLTAAQAYVESCVEEAKAALGDEELDTGNAPVSNTTSGVFL